MMNNDSDAPKKRPSDEDVNPNAKRLSLDPDLTAPFLPLTEKDVQLPFLENDSAAEDSQSVYQDLVETRTYLEKLRAEQPGVSAHFDDWVGHRRSTIETVDRLRDKIDSVFVNSNVAKGFAAGAGFGSVVAGMAGQVVEDRETAESLNTVSTVLAGTSIVTLVTTTLAEIGLTQSAINEVNRVLEEDMELTKPLRNCIQFSHDIDSRFNRLFKCSIASDTFASVKKVFLQCRNLLGSGSVSIQDLIHDLRNHKLEGIEDLTMEISDKVIDFLNGISTNPEWHQPFVEIWNIIIDDPHTLELAKVGLTIYSKTIVDLLESQSIVAKLLSTVGITIASLAPCGLNVISLASNVISLIFAVKNIHEGASEYSESLDRVRMTLTSELRVVSEQMPLNSFRLPISSLQAEP